MLPITKVAPSWGTTVVEVSQSARDAAADYLASHLGYKQSLMECAIRDKCRDRSNLVQAFATFEAQAEARGRIAGLREAAKAIERANDRVMGIETPAMQGDNLAVTLCSHFEDDGDDEDDNGWNEAATTGYEEVRAAIQNHYSAAIANLIPGEKA